MEVKTHDKRQSGTVIVAVVLGALLVLGLHTQGKLLRTDWMAAGWWLVPMAMGVGWKLWRVGADKETPSGEAIEWPGLALCLFLWLYLFSSAALDRKFYFLHWPPGGSLGEQLLFSPPGQFMLAATAFTLLLLCGRVRRWLVLSALLAVGVAVAVAGFWAATGGEPLYGDDHASFMFRLWLFADAFPRLPYYNPFWNGGQTVNYIVGSGTQGLGSLLLPLWKSGAIDRVYNPGILLYFLVLTPLLAALSCRLMGGRRTAMLVGAILAVGTGRHFAMWLLHFGTVGASAATPWVMPICAALYRVLCMERREWWLAVGLVAASTFFLSWPGHAFIALPIVVAVLATLPFCGKRVLLFLAGCGVVTLVCVLPFALVILHYSDPVAFAGVQSPGTELGLALRRGWERFGIHLRQAHPAILFLGLAGAWVQKERRGRIFLGCVTLLLLALASWGAEWKPQFQLGRAAIPLGFVGLLPASLWIERVTAGSSPLRVPVQGGLLALLLMGMVNTARIYNNQLPARFRTRPEEVVQFTRWIEEHVPRQGRLLFAGPTVHGFGGGHVAPLPAFTGREMMACDYYHFSPSRVVYEYPPYAFLDPPARLVYFMELYNVTHVATYHPYWVRGLRAMPDHFAEVYSFGAKTKKHVFRVLREPDFFHRGEGEIRSAVNRLDVRVRNPDAEVVLKYHWRVGLSADDPVRIRPYDMGDGITFIAVHPGGRSDFSIYFRKWL